MDNSSQNFFDIYSFSHISHGILLYFFFHTFLKFSILNGLILAIIVEVLWELIENSEYIIKKYRKKYKGYYGDSKLNIFGDVFFMVFGHFLCHKSNEFGIFLLIFMEIALYPFNANLYQLSIGSLSH